MHVHVHTMAPMWRSQDNLWRWLSPSMWVGPGTFYPLSHLMDPGLEPDCLSLWPPDPPHAILRDTVVMPGS